MENEKTPKPRRRAPAPKPIPNRDDSNEQIYISIDLLRGDLYAITPGRYPDNEVHHYQLGMDPVGLTNDMNTNDQVKLKAFLKKLAEEHLGD